MRQSSIAVLAGFLGLTLACGGGGGGGGQSAGPAPTPLIARFTGDPGTPTALTISMSEASHTQDVVVVAVSVTDTPNLFGAALDVVYDPAKVEYDDSVSQPGWSSGSAFEQGGVSPIYQVGVAAPGRLIVSVARPGAAGAVNVTGTQPMIRLRFRATLAATSRLDAQNGTLYDGSLPPNPIPGTNWKGGAVTAS